MGIDTGVPGGSRQVLILTVWNMKMRLGVAVLLGQTKINHVDLVSPLADAHQKVVRLDVTVNERLGVNILDPGDELIRQQEHGFQGEFAVAKVKEILQTRSQQIEDHSIVVTLGSKPADKRDPDASRE